MAAEPEVTACDVSAEAEVPDTRPNIFCFVADQMRADSLHHLGNEASITPNLDALAQEGVSFENAYCQNPVCVPSRCSFLTGLYPHTTGHRTMHYLQRDESEPNILREMKNAGYEVVWIGRNDVIPGDRDKTPYCDMFFDGIRPYDSKAEPRPFAPNKGKKRHEPTPEEIADDNFYSFYVGRLDQDDPRGKNDWNCVQAALDYLDRRAEQGSDKPFFVYCTITFPHPPYMCEDPWYSSIDRAALPPRRPNMPQIEGKASMLYGINAKQNLNGWTEERFDELRATYLAMCSRFDHQWGLIEDKLKETGVFDDTTVFVWSDHGDYTGDYGITEKVQNCFEDPISNVPLIVKPASRFVCEPRVTPALAELTDISATIADMSDVTFPWVSFGKSLLPVCAGADEHRACVICEGGRIHGETQAMELGHGPASPYWPRLSTQASEGPEHTKACMIRMGNYKYTMRLYERDEFYDLSLDPMEIENRIDDPSYADAIQRMRMQLLETFMATGDYVPNGKDIR